MQLLLFIGAPIARRFLVVSCSSSFVMCPTAASAWLRSAGAARGPVTSGLIALHGEAGFQPQVLRGGIHVLNRVQYRLHIMPMVTIAQGKIGYLFARDGKPLSPMQTLGANVGIANFEETEAFLASGGQRGPQRQILREGTYAINLALFVVITMRRCTYLRLSRTEDKVFEAMADVIEDRHGFEPLVIRGAVDMVGIVTVHDGPELGSGEIIAPVVGGDSAAQGSVHNNFQDPEKFLAAGGRRGRQLQVLVDGTYAINRLLRRWS